jgi:putative oxidoreductase
MNFFAKIFADDLGKLLVRLSAGGLMLFHGIHKLQHGAGGIEDILRANNLPAGLAIGVYVGEVVAPILILIGFFARPAGLVLSFNMLVAVLLVHTKDLTRITPQGAWAMELQTFYFLGGLAVFFLGAGRFSVSRGKGMWN